MQGYQPSFFSPELLPAKVPGITRTYLSNALLTSRIRISFTNFTMSPPRSNRLSVSCSRPSSVRISEFTTFACFGKNCPHKPMNLRIRVATGMRLLLKARVGRIGVKVLG
jgi:hypothetical protein